MWLKVIATFIISLAVFLLQSFFSGWPIIINLFVVLIVWLSLKRSYLRWFYAWWGGLLLDLAYGTFGVNLLSLLLLIVLLDLFTSQISSYNFFAKFLSTMGGILSSLLINYFITIAFSLFFTSVAFYSFNLSIINLINYFVINSLLVILLSSVFDKKAVKINYETF